MQRGLRVVDGGIIDDQSPTFFDTRNPESKTIDENLETLGLNQDPQPTAGQNIAPYHEAVVR